MHSRKPKSVHFENGQRIDIDEQLCASSRRQKCCQLWIKSTGQVFMYLKNVIDWSALMCTPKHDFLVTTLKCVIVHFVWIVEKWLFLCALSSHGADFHLPSLTRLQRRSSGTDWMPAGRPSSVQINLNECFLF